MAAASFAAWTGSKHLAAVGKRYWDQLHARGGRNGCDSAIDGQAESQGLWSAMRHGDLKEFRRLAEEDGHSLLVRGPVGETLLHMCFVYQLPNLQEFVDYMLSKHPQLIHRQYDMFLVMKHAVWGRERLPSSDLPLEGFNYTPVPLLWADCSMAKVAHQAERSARPEWNGPYDGETVLHIAIVNRRPDMVRMLLSRCRRLIRMRAFGSFFSLEKFFDSGKQSCYYGEYPLSFAAATNQPDMVSILCLECGLADIGAADSHGNTALHVAVLHRNAEMYHFLLEVAAKQLRLHRKIDDPLQISLHIEALQMQRNKDGLTAFVLAAEQGDSELVQRLLDSQARPEWEFGPVTCALYPLAELDGTEIHRKTRMLLPWRSDGDGGDEESTDDDSDDMDAAAAGPSGGGEAPGCDAPQSQPERARGGTAVRAQREGGVATGQPVFASALLGWASLLCCFCMEFNYSKWRRFLRDVCVCCPGAFRRRGVSVGRMVCGAAGCALTAATCCYCCCCCGRMLEAAAGSPSGGDGPSPGQSGDEDGDDDSGLEEGGMGAALWRASSEPEAKPALEGEATASLSTRSHPAQALSPPPSLPGYGSASDGAAGNERLPSLGSADSVDHSRSARRRLRAVPTVSIPKASPRTSPARRSIRLAPSRTVVDVTLERGHLDVLAIPQLDTLLQRKWVTIAEPFVMQRRLIFAMYLAVFTLCCGVSSSFVELKGLPWVVGPATAMQAAFANDHFISAAVFALLGLGEAAVILVAILKFRIELGELASDGPQQYFGQMGAAMIENWASITHCVTLLATIALTFGHWLWPGTSAAIDNIGLKGCTMPQASGALQTKIMDQVDTACDSGADMLSSVLVLLWHSDVVLMPVSALACWFYSLWFLIGDKSTGPLVVMVLQILRNDFSRFFVLAVVMLLGFTHAYSLVTDHHIFETLPMLILTMAGSLPETGLGPSEGGDADASTMASSFFLVLYVIMVTIVLINILIAMLNDSYESVSKTSRARWLFERARIITSLESEMSLEARRQQHFKYWVAADTSQSCSADYRAFVRIEGYKGTEGVCDEAWQRARAKLSSLAEGDTLARSPSSFADSDDEHVALARATARSREIRERKRRERKAAAERRASDDAASTGDSPRVASPWGAVLNHRPHGSDSDPANSDTPYGFAATAVDSEDESEGGSDGDNSGRGPSPPRTRGSVRRASVQGRASSSARPRRRRRRV